MRKIFLILSGLLLALASLHAHAILLQFDNNDGACTGTIIPNGTAGCSDKTGNSLTYNAGFANLSVTSSTQDVIQDLTPTNGGLGANDSAGLLGDNTEIGQYLDFVFTQNVLLAGIAFNGGTGNGHGDSWGATLDEIELSLWSGGGLIGALDFDLTGDGSLLLNASILAGDVLRVTANVASHYVESLTVTAGGSSTTFEVPEPFTLSFMGLGLLGMGLMSLRGSRRRRT